MDNDCDKRQTECFTVYASDPKKDEICNGAIDVAKARAAAVAAAAAAAKLV